MKPLLILKTYAWLVNTIRNHGPISYKDILELWNNDRLSEGNNMVRQTFIHYKNDLEEFFNISIGCDRQYRYYIKNGAELQKDTVENWMMSSLSVNSTLLKNKRVYKRIVMWAQRCQTPLRPRSPQSSHPQRVSGLQERSPYR